MIGGNNLKCLLVDISPKSRGGNKGIRERISNMVSSIEEEISIDTLENYNKISDILEEKEYDALIFKPQTIEKKAEILREVEKKGYRIPFCVRCMDNPEKIKDNLSNAGNGNHSRFNKDPKVIFRNYLENTYGIELLHPPQVHFNGGRKENKLPKHEFSFYLIVFKN